MAKRFTDSNKWNDPWYSDLPNKYKLLYLYLLDSCDHAGIWKVNFKLASFMIGESLEPSEVKRIFSGRVRFIDDEYWFIEKFIAFQYGALKGDKTALSCIKILEKHGLHDVIQTYKQGASEPLGSPLLGVQVKDKDKVMDMDMDNNLKSKNFSNIFPTIEQCRQIAEMSGHEPEYGEAYFHMRDADGWCKPRGKGENMQMIPIANWRSDYANMYNQGYLKYKNDTGLPF